MKALILSGPIGTRVIDMALETGVNLSPKQAMEIILHFEPMVSRILEEYACAGADIMLAPLIGANRYNLHNLKSVIDTNNSIVSMTRETVPNTSIAAMIAWPQGKYLAEDNAIMKEQCKVLAETDIDMWMIETITGPDIAEAMAENALEASAKAGREIPLNISLTPVPGFDIRTAINRILPLEPHTIGFNCFFPPQNMDELISLLPSNVDFSLRPAISMPGSDETTPEDLCKYFSRHLSNPHLKYVGTCCGAKPIHTQLLKNLISNA